MTPDQTQKFIDVALGYVGTRYRHQGRVPGIGLDCGGLVVCAAREAGVNVVDMAGYSSLPSALQLVSVMRKNCDEVREMKPGDILAFAWGAEPQHLAVLISDTHIVHSHAAARKVVTHRLDAEWRGRMTNIFRFK